MSYGAESRMMAYSDGTMPADKRTYGYDGERQEDGLRLRRLRALGGGVLVVGAAQHGIKQQFTAKERDQESGLDYFLARYYGSSIGRFTSPDESFVDQFRTNPQSWNLYTYVRNNPLRFMDPTGRVCRQLPDGNFEGDCASPGDEKVTQGGGQGSTTERDGGTGKRRGLRCIGANGAGSDRCGKEATRRSTQ